MDVLFYLLLGALVFLVAAVCVLVVLVRRGRREMRRLELAIEERASALEQESTLLNTVIDAIPDVLFCKDLESRYIRINKSFEELFDLKREDFLGKTDAGLVIVPEDVYKEWREGDSKTIREQSHIRVEETVTDAYGATHELDTIKIPLFQNGEVFGILGLARDITQHKELEKHLRAASRAKSEFIANMSHEIRTPMNSIVGFSELALEGETDPKTRTYLERIIENSQWLLQIINDILDISKIEADRLELELVPFDPSELFVQCQTNVAPKAIEKGLELVFYIEPFTDSKLLVGDPVRLRQILINIVSNAIKFTDTGIVKIIASVTNETENSKTIYFEIRDTGIGMSSEQINRIFEPFVQADSGITRKYGGTGLGLSIVNNLLGIMGGELHIESEPGKGSVFSFTLDFEAVELTMSMPERHTLLDISEKPYFSGEVLVCEDNIMNQMVITEHLSRVGLACTIAENGAIGVELVKNRARDGEPPFDLILMDIHMPVMDGLEAAEKIIALELEMDISTPIVAMTANVMVNDREIYRQRGMEHCIGKPFTSQELWEGLLKYLKPKGWTNRGVNVSVHTDSDADAPNQLHDRLVTLFLRDNRNRFSQISDCLNKGDIRQAHILAHTLKSSAALIKKTRLQDVAAEVESLLSDGEDKTTDIQMLKLRTELRHVLDELESMPLAKSDVSAMVAPDNKAGAHNPKDLRKLLCKLEPLLKNRSTESLDFLDNLRAHALPGTIKLAEEIESYDFKPALQTLAELNREWGV